MAIKAAGLCAFLLVGILAIGSAGYAVPIFQDAFTHPNGLDPEWSNDLLTFSVLNGRYVPPVYDNTPGGLHAISVINDPANPSQLLTLDNLAFFVESYNASDTGIVFHYTDVGNHVFFILAHDAIYFHSPVDGDNGPQLSRIPAPGLDYSKVTLAVTCKDGVAVGGVSDGTRGYATQLNLTSNTGPGGVGLMSWEWQAGRLEAMFDNVLIVPAADEVGTLTGTISDSASGAPIANAVVEKTGSPGISAVTGPDGEYSLSNVPVGPIQLTAYANGYNRTHFGGIVMSGQATSTSNAKLDPYPGLDQARCAAARASSSAVEHLLCDWGVPCPPRSTPTHMIPYNMIDGWQGHLWYYPRPCYPLPLRQGWRPAVEQVGEWAEIYWAQPVTISTIFIDMSGPTQDYIVQSSMDGTSWSDIKEITSTETGHTHWKEQIDLPSPLTTKHLRVLINTSTEPGDIWVIEAFKPRGTVSGFLKDSTGAPVAGATVVATDADTPTWDGTRDVTAVPAPATAFIRGDTDCPFAATTQQDGSYTMQVPECSRAMVTGAAIDSFGVASAPFAVVAGQQTVLPDLVVTRVGAAQAFSDDFNDIPDGQTDPRWTNVDQPWTVQNQIYVSPGGIASLVKNMSCRDAAVGVDSDGAGFVTFRYHDADNCVLAGRQDVRGDLYWHERTAGAWTTPGRHCYIPFDTPQTNNRPNPPFRFRAIVYGNQGESCYTDGKNTYWSDKVTLSTFAGFGSLGTGGIGLWAGTRWDNFNIYEGAAPAPSRVGEAKARGVFSSGVVKGIVTAIFREETAFVIEDEDRSNALMVDGLRPSIIQVGDEVILEGYAQANGTLRMVGDAVETGRTNVAIEPLEVNNQSINGALSTIGLNNLGLLVSTCGTVLDTPAKTPSGGTVFHISDGSMPVEAATEPLMWELRYSDAFQSGKNLIWVDYGVATSVSGGKFVFPSRTRTGLSGVSELDVATSVDAKVNEQAGILLRVKDGVNLLMATYAPIGGWQGGPGAWGRIFFYQFLGGVWSDPLNVVEMPNMLFVGPDMRMSVRVIGSQAVFTVTDGLYKFTTTRTLTSPTLLAAGTAGLGYKTGSLTQYFDNYTLYKRTGVGGLVSSGCVEVIVPPSVTVPTLQVGDSVKVVGVACKGEALNGPIRAVRTSDSIDVRKITK